jgi:hypothetical protein
VLKYNSTSTAANRTWKALDSYGPTYMWHPNGYPSEQAAQLHSQELIMPRYAVGDWVWAIWNQQSGFWEAIEGIEDIWRFVLTEDLYECSSADAKMILKTGSFDVCNPTDIDLTVVDRIGAVKASAPQAVRHGSGLWYLPSGTLGYAKRFADSGDWELLQAGSCDCDDSSSSSSSSGISCVTILDGVTLDELPIADIGDVAHLIGLDGNGCLVRVPITEC